ncbi:hypothetical protein IWQ61_002862 [Dispira simplex]|nr:hypothetical protein IWQ61_002862 [Dispira simplex]
MTLEELEEEEDLTFQLKKTPTERAFTKRKDRTSKIKTKVESSSVENPTTPASPRSQPIYNKDALEELKRQQWPPRMDTFVADSTATSTSLPAFPLSEPSNSGNLSLKELISEQVRQGRIPDSKLIQAARQEREKLRLAHEGDFIPLSSSTNHPGPTLHSLTLDDGQYDELDDFDLQILREDDRKARYIDEDEVVLSAEEDDLTFGSKARQLREERELETRQRALEEAENEILYDNDDEIRHWEMEQIKKGGAEGAIQSFKHDRDTLVHKIHQAIKVTPIPTLTAFQSRIRQRLAQVEETQKANRYDQDQLNKQVEHAQDLLTKAFTERTVLEQRLAHYTKLLQEREKKGVADSAPVSPQSSTPRFT